MLTGPTVVNCFNSPDGMGQCIRGKMTDAGLFPQPAPAPAVAETAPAPEAAPAAPEPATPAPEPAPSVPTSAQASDVIAATFGLLRAEPDGSVVIAGSGTPGSEVEVYSDDTLLGSAKVEPSGDWVIVPDAPIAPGGTEITLAEAGKTGRAAESFVVVINDDKTSQPLVVASTPGKASDVLQGLTAPAAGTTTEVAAATTPPAAATPAAPAPTPAEPAAAPAEAPAPIAEPAPVTPAPADVAPANPAPAIETAPAPAAEPAPTAEAPAASAAPTRAAPVATTPEAVVAAATPDVATPAPAAAAAVPPTIDAIEIEGDKTFFAGGGKEGSTVRLYVDDSFVADTKVADGRWLVEAGPVLTKPTQRIRIDMLEPGSASVASRAEVDFAVEMPAATPPVQVAETPEPAVAAPAAPAPAVEASQQPEVAPAPVAEPAPAAASAPTPAAETPAAPEPAIAAPAAPATPEPAIAAAEPAVATPAEPAAAPASTVPTMVGVAVGNADSQRFASGKAIIRRGDNLWTIARRVYGAGNRYTTIYEANTGQIRDPDRIYPGQVFELPKGE